MPRFVLIPLALLVGFVAWVGATLPGAPDRPSTRALSPADTALPARAPAAGSTPPLTVRWPVPPPLATRAAPERPARATVPGRSERVTMLVPRLGLRVRVVDAGVDATGRPAIAAGRVITHLRFTAGPGRQGNYVAYGHDDIQGSVFRYLEDLRVGDMIELAQSRAHYVYRVTRSRVVWPSDVSVLAPTRAPTLTLISCTPYMVDTQRIVISAALVT